MGAWGTGPFDNDDACDWRDKHFGKILRETVLSSNYAEEIFAALTAIYYMDLEYQYDTAEIKRAFAKIEAQDLMDNWKDYSGRRSAVNKLRKLLLSRRQH